MFNLRVKELKTPRMHDLHIPIHRGMVLMEGVTPLQSNATTAAAVTTGEKKNTWRMKWNVRRNVCSKLKCNFVRRNVGCIALHTPIVTHTDALHQCAC